VRLDAANTNIGFAANALGLKKSRPKIKKIENLFIISVV
jgi:hypothetical protein